MNFNFSPKKYLLAIFLLGLMSIFLPNIAKSQIFDSKFDNWIVYEKEVDAKEKVCYTMSSPVFSDTDFPNRQNPFFMIVRSSKTREEDVLIFSGFELKNKDLITVKINQKQFILDAEENFALLKDKEKKIDFIKSILDGYDFKIRSNSAFGKFAVDNYLTKGVNDAYFRIRQLCP